MRANLRRNAALGHDAVGRTHTHIRLSEDAQGRVIADTRLEYDIQQRLRSRTEWGTERQQYVYDAESQLTGVYVGQHWLEYYAYDPAGNRAASHRGPATVESGNRLTRPGADTYEYDARGNVIASTVDGRPWTFEYDLRNQMVAAHGPSGTVRFGYDALGRRISKTTDSRQIRYVWCGEQVMREIITTEQGVVTRDYLYQPSTYKPHAMRIGADCYFFHSNHASTPERITNASGQIVWSARYESFGEAHIDVAHVDNPLRFQGQYYDEETKLHYNRFRYYSPRLGRYFSVDPIGLLGGHNLYTYVGNDPINRTDPLGLWWEVAVSALAAGAVAAAVVLTAPVSLPILAVGALAVMSGVVVGLGVHDGITQYQETGHVCVPCLLWGAAKSVGIGLAVVGAAALFPAAATAIGVAALVVGAGSLAYTLWNWDNMNHDERMDATGGVLGGVIFAAGARAISGVRGLLRGGGAPEEGGPKVPPAPTEESTGAKPSRKGVTKDPRTGKENSTVENDDAIVPDDKVDKFMRGKTQGADENLKQQVKDLNAQKQQDRKAWDANPENEKNLQRLKKSQENKQRSQDMGETLEEAGIPDTPEENARLKQHLLDQGEKPTPENREVASEIDGSKGRVKLLSTWVQLPDGRWQLATVKAIPIDSPPAPNVPPDSPPPNVPPKSATPPAVLGSGTSGDDDNDE